jgi:hypothetical protein
MSESAHPPQSLQELGEPALAFVRSLGEMVTAEAELSVAASLRAALLGVVAVLALVAAWIALSAAAAFALATSIGAAPACLVVALAHATLAALAWWRRRAWQKHIGFGHTRRLLQSALTPPDAPP